MYVRTLVDDCRPGNLLRQLDHALYLQTTSEQLKLHLYTAHGP